MLSKITLLFVSILAINFSYSQDFDTKINTTAQELAKKIASTNKQKVAIVEFENLDNTQTQLGVFLADEIASSLANLTENQSKFTVVERANLDQILEEKRILKSFDRSKLARDLGKIDAAEILISATITEFNGYYRLNIKLLDTKSGNSLGSYKVSFVQEPSLKELQKEIVETSSTTNSSTPKPAVQETSPQIKQPKVEEIKTVSKGDVCFNIATGSWNAKVNLKSINGNENLKSIDVLSNQGSSCVYNIPIGVYQIEIDWRHSLGNQGKVMTQEIKISADKENKYELKYIY